VRCASIATSSAPKHLRQQGFIPNKRSLGIKRPMLHKVIRVGSPQLGTRNGTRNDFGLLRIFRYLAATPRPVKLLKSLIGKNWEAGVLPLNYSRPADLMILAAARQKSPVVTCRFPVTRLPTAHCPLTTVSHFTRLEDVLSSRFGREEKAAGRGASERSASRGGQRQCPWPRPAVCK
jgi:hypothetical protein